ncbi:hypothetical protein T484DRAFT_1757387 [Baffinella frigidus]|nr:hypothetical protein T484DRAFT_1757387 [Cryptophyta sp. CCMP2293]
MYSTMYSTMNSMIENVLSAVDNLPELGVEVQASHYNTLKSFAVCRSIFGIVQGAIASTQAPPLEVKEDPDPIDTDSDDTGVNTPPVEMLVSCLVVLVVLLACYWYLRVNDKGEQPRVENIQNAREQPRVENIQNAREQPRVENIQNAREQPRVVNPLHRIAMDGYLRDIRAMKARGDDLFHLRAAMQARVRVLYGIVSEKVLERFAETHCATFNVYKVYRGMSLYQIADQMEIAYVDPREFQAACLKVIGTPVVRFKPQTKPSIMRRPIVADRS